MSGLELRSAGPLSDEELAALFTASYEGYVVPLALDAGAVRFLTETFDLDRDASRIAVREGTPIGLANLGLRGSDAWIGGIGVVTSERRTGVGRALLEAVHEAARGHGVERVWLEVIAENVGAVGLYEDLGYEHVRDVAVWSLPAPASMRAAVEEVDAAEAHARIRERRTQREPWQRDDESLANMRDVRGLVAGSAAAVVRLTGTRVGVVQLVGDHGSLRDLLAAAASLGESLSILNLPSGHPASAALEELGGRVDVTQHEMVLRL